MDLTFQVPMQYCSLENRTCFYHQSHPKLGVVFALAPSILYMDITRWSTLKSDYILCSQIWRSSIQSAKTRPRADCGSDHELLIAKFRIKLKKVGKTTKPFRYDLNQIPYDYTLEVRNRFKGLDLIDRVSEELWTEVCDIVQEAGIKMIPEKKKYKKAKWLSEEALQIVEKREKLKAKEKRKDINI